MKPAVIRDDGVAAADAKGLGRDPDPRRRLSALVLGTIDETDHGFDHLAVDPLGDHFHHRQIALDIALDHSIEVVIGRQAVLVGLIGSSVRPTAACR